MSFGRFGALGRGFGRLGGGLGSSQGSGGGPVFVPDTTPSAYRTTTQTMIAGRNANSATATMPQLSSEFAIATWFRSTTTAEGFLWNFYDPSLTSGAQALGGGSLAAMALYYSAGSPGTASAQNRFSLTGTDKDGNHIAAGTIAVNTYGSAYGYSTTETIPNAAGYGVLMVTQYRSGNIELWAVYRGMAPRLLIQQACTWNGTGGPLVLSIGGANVTINSGGSIELEMPTVIPDRSLSIIEMSQLADGISPEALNAASAKASASMAFFNVAVDGLTTASDRLDGTGLADGNTITLNGDVFTARTAPSLGTEFQTYADYVGNMSADSATDIFTTATAHGMPNGRRVCLARSVVIGGTDPAKSYYIINQTSTTFQLSLTPGGSAIDVTVNGTNASSRVSCIPTALDNLVTLVNALTPNLGGASNASYAVHGAYTLVMSHRLAGGTSFTFDSNATSVRFPANKRLALAWSYITDYTGFKVGLYGSAGIKRNRTVAWTVPTLGELAPNTQITGSMRVNSWTDGMGTNSVAGTSYITVSGSYTGNDPVQGGQIKFTDQNGFTTVQDFSAFTSFSYSSVPKTWTGKLTVPAGKRWLSCEMKKTGSTQVSHRSEVRFHCGLVILTHGRSHATDWYGTYASNDVSPNGFCSQFTGTGMTAGANGFYAIDNTWHRYDVTGHVGAGVAVFSNKVSNDNSLSVSMITRAIGGVSFATLNDPAIWTAFQADLATTWADTSLMPPAFCFIWTHSGEDYLTPTDILTTLRTNLTTYVGASCKLGVVTSLTAKDAVDSTTLTARVRSQQIAYKVARLAASDTTVFDAGDYQYVTNTTDGIHANNISDHKTKCEIHAIAVNAALAGNMKGGTGPIITSATRTGAVIDLFYDLNGATALAISNVGADVSGFDVALTSASFLPLVGTPAFDNTTDTFTQSAHGWSNNDPVILSTNAGTIPTGYSGGVKYFIVNAATNTYQLAATVGGAAINGTTNGSALYAFNTKSLLTKSTVALGPAANQVKITLSADPGASCQVVYNLGRPGRQNVTTIDPNVVGDPTGTTTMMELWSVAQANPLCDNTSLTYPSTTTVGRLARMTTAAVLAA